MSLLAGIKVVVLAHRLVDFGGSMLARLGAQVTLAHSGSLSEPRRAAWHFGMEVSGAPLSDLLQHADVLLDDRRTDQTGRADELAVARPDLIHVVATGWPDDARPVTDLTLMAQSGLMKVIGWPDRPPLRLPGEQAYVLTGIQAATAALMGLRARRLTGRGQRITVSALQSAVLANYRTAIMYDWTGKIGTRAGNRLVRGKSGVEQVWRCRDGFVTWAMVDNPGMMRAIVGAMVAEGAAAELAAIDWDTILVADTDQAQIDRWQQVFGAWFLTHNRDALAAMSLEQGWGLSPIIPLADVPDSAQMQARGMFVRTAEGARIPGPLFAVHHPEKAP